MAGGSETLASPMGAPACGIKVAAQAGLQPWFQHSRHTSRAAITPESTAAKRTLVCRSFGIGSPITGIYDTSYYTATPHPSSIQQPRCLNFRLPERKIWPLTVTACPQATTNKTAKQQRNKSATQKGRARRPFILPQTARAARGRYYTYLLHALLPLMRPADAVGQPPFCIKQHGARPVYHAESRSIDKFL